MLRHLSFLSRNPKFSITVMVIIAIMITYYYMKMMTVMCMPASEGTNLDGAMIQTSMMHHEKMLQMHLTNTANAHINNVRSLNSTLYALSLVGQFPDWYSLNFYIKSATYEVYLTTYTMHTAATEMTDHIDAMSKISPLSPMIMEGIHLRSEALENMRDSILLSQKVHELFQVESTKLTNVSAQDMETLNKSLKLLNDTITGMQKECNFLDSFTTPQLIFKQIVAKVFEQEFHIIPK